MKSNKQEWKKRYNLGKERITKILLGFRALVFNYLANDKTYRQKGAGDEGYIFNFLYKLIKKYSSLRHIFSKARSINLSRFCCRVSGTVLECLSVSFHMFQNRNHSQDLQRNQLRQFNFILCRSDIHSNEHSNTLHEAQSFWGRQQTYITQMKRVPYKASRFVTD